MDSNATRQPRTDRCRPKHNASSTQNSEGCLENSNPLWCTASSHLSSSPVPAQELQMLQQALTTQCSVRDAPGSLSCSEDVSYSSIPPSLQRSTSELVQRQAELARQLEDVAADAVSAPLPLSLPAAQEQQQQQQQHSSSGWFTREFHQAVQAGFQGDCCCRSCMTYRHNLQAAVCAALSAASAAASMAHNVSNSRKEGHCVADIPPGNWYDLPEAQPEPLHHLMQLANM